MKRGAIFIDNGYWVKITLSHLTSPEWIVKNIKAWVPEVADIQQWIVYVYDAVYDRDWVRFYEEQMLLPKGVAKFHYNELVELQKLGFIVRKGVYTVRKENGGKPKLQQKGVDSLLVIDAMDELHHFDTDVFCFVTADRDFVPVLRRILMKEGATPYLLYSKLSGSIGGIEDQVKGLVLREISESRWQPGGKVRKNMGGPTT